MMKPMKIFQLPRTLAGREQLSNFSCRPNAYRKGLSEEPPRDFEERGTKKGKKWMKKWWLIIFEY